MEQSTRHPHSPASETNSDGPSPVSCSSCNAAATHSSPRLSAGISIRDSPSPVLQQENSHSRWTKHAQSQKRRCALYVPVIQVPFRSTHPPIDTIARYRRDNDIGITGPLMAQYLSALMSMRGGVDPFASGNQGRWGDYAFTQEGTLALSLSHGHTLTRRLDTALDQIITQLMENSNSSRPVPATEDIMSKLPREVLEVGCASVRPHGCFGGAEGSPRSPNPREGLRSL